MNRDSGKIFDEYLVAASATGDREALGRLVARWQPKLLRHAWRVIGDAELAKDVVQESWVDILRGLARLDDVAAFPAWAYRIVTRRCQRRFRTAAIEPQPMDDAALPEQSAVPAHETGEFAMEVAIALRAIGRLPGPQRAALALFYIEQLSVAEISVALDVAPGTIKTRLMHARRKVRALLEADANEQD